PDGGEPAALRVQTRPPPALPARPVSPAARGREDRAGSHAWHTAHKVPTDFPCRWGLWGPGAGVRGPAGIRLTAACAGAAMAVIRARALESAGLERALQNTEFGNGGVVGECPAARRLPGRDAPL